MRLSKTFKKKVGLPLQGMKPLSMGPALYADHVIIIQLRPSNTSFTCHISGGDD